MDKLSSNFSLYGRIEKSWEMEMLKIIFHKKFGKADWKNEKRDIFGYDYKTSKSQQSL